MIRYQSQHQLTFEEFRTPFEMNLPRENRWIQLAHALPWDRLAAVYYRTMSATQGRPATDARIVIGALIIKHKEGLSDEDTLRSIQENVYQQYFLGLRHYQYEWVFDPSLLVTIRKRLGEHEFDAMVLELLHLAERFSTDVGTVRESSSDEGTDGPSFPTSPTRADGGSEKTGLSTSLSSSNEEAVRQEAVTNRGLLIADLTVAPADIAYPTDMELLNRAREKTEALIDELYASLPVERRTTKPRTYRRKARKDYLKYAKMKKRSGKTIRKAIRKQLGYVKRNIKTIHALLDVVPEPCSSAGQTTLWVVQELYRQQQEMYTTKTHRIDDRIVSIAQPHVRPIVRGKAKAPTEFGAQVSCSVMNGFSRIHRIAWDSYHEASDLPAQIEEYKLTYGYYPQVVLADKKYGTRENRAYMKTHNIIYGGTPLGRPRNDGEGQAVTKAVSNLRNHIEGKFGTGKRSYRLDKIMARRSDTSASWIAAIFFVMNIQTFIKFFVSLCLVVQAIVYAVWLQHSRLITSNLRFHRL
ncbi:MAG: IS5 family transposase [Ignavibacteriae bacterium]|nr:IS5 family transposase [Ignavibacteriota bacterium]